jgi:hypothetical protein
MEKSSWIAVQACVDLLYVAVPRSPRFLIAIADAISPKTAFGDQPSVSDHYGVLSLPTLGCGVFIRMDTHAPIVRAAPVFAASPNGH